MKTDRGKVLRRKVEKNAERQVKRTWNCIEGTEWEEEEQVHGLLCACEKGQRAWEEKGFHRGHSYRMLLLGASKLPACAEEKSFNRCSGLAAVSEVGRQFIVSWLFGVVRLAHQSRGLALLKFSSLHPVLNTDQGVLIMRKELIINNNYICNESNNIILVIIFLLLWGEFATIFKIITLS